MKEMKETKRRNTKVDVGTLVTAKVREMEEKTRDGRSRRTRKEAVGCVEAMVGNKKFLVRFKDGQMREMSSSSLSYVCSEEEVCQEVNETISDLRKKRR